MSEPERVVALAERSGHPEAANAREWLEAHREALATLPPAEAPRSSLDGDAHRNRKQARDREREKYRARKSRAKIEHGADGRVIVPGEVPWQPNTKTLAEMLDDEFVRPDEAHAERVSTLQWVLRDATKGVDPSGFPGELKVRLAAHAGKIPREAFERVRAMYDASRLVLSSDEWKRRLRVAFRSALRLRRGDGLVIRRHRVANPAGRDTHLVEMDFASCDERASSVSVGLQQPVETSVDLEWTSSASRNNRQVVRRIQLPPQRVFTALSGLTAPAVLAACGPADLSGGFPLSRGARACEPDMWLVSGAHSGTVALVKIWTGWWLCGVVPLLVAGACSSSDKPSGLKCGEGTHAVGDSCVASTGGSGGASDASGAAGSCMTGNCAQSGATQVGQSGAGENSDAGAAGNEGGAPALGGGGAGGASAGAGGGTTAGTGGAAGGGDAPPAPTRWLAFASDPGVYVYDLSQFPASTGLVNIDKYGTSLFWSPDSKWLTFESYPSYYSVDMTGNKPGTALLVAGSGFPDESITTGKRFSWCSDSRSVAALNGKALSVFDARIGAPPLHSVSTTLRSYQWAPVGKRLLYSDATGNHVVEVDAGTPGQPIDVDTSAKAWSPDGNALVGVQGSDVYLTTLDGSSSVPVKIGTDASFSVVTFNADSTKVVYYAGNDLNVVQVKPTVGAPQHPYATLPSATQARFALWSPKGTWLLYQLKGTSSTDVTWAVTNMSGDTAQSPITVGAPTVTSFSWTNASAPQLYGVGSPQNSLYTFDPGAKAPALVPLITPTSIAQLAISPANDSIGYLSTIHSLSFVDAHVPQATSNDTIINSGIIDDSVYTWGWSGDGKFAAAVENVQGNGYLQYLIRVQNGVPSTPVKLNNFSGTTPEISFAFSP